ncbi:antibiotic biosynthesis monooxygenase family protein [Neobacillus sp. LXY-1]|uniref:antibiotic biosynthesis monooxygenase family protein n=1 Tax=Neobacillus sp. LXY-1 TaxID=3379133 RepID=UPI003EDF119C
MNVFITTGTYDFLKKIESKYPKELILTLVNSTGALLFHETPGKTVFQAPRKYDIFAAEGNLTKEGFVVMNHLPVTDEGRPLIEYEIKKGVKAFGTTTGLKAMRALRPGSTNTYIFMTVWVNEASYDDRKDTNHPFVNLSDPKILAGPAYIHTYSITE